MNAELTLKPIQTFAAFFGEKKIGTFTLESEWNGLAELRNERGEVLIVNRAESLNRAMRLLYVGDEKVSVFKAAPVFVAQMIEANRAASEKEKEKEAEAEKEPSHPA